MEEKKQIIIEKTLELFSRYGIRSVSMDDIAGELGFSKKTLYQYFRDKQDLVLEAMRFSASGITNHFCIFEQDPRNAIESFLCHRKLLLEKLSKFNHTLVYDLRKYFPAIYNELKDLRIDQLYHAHLINLEQGMEEGLYRPDLDPKMIAKFMTVHHIYTFDPINGFFTDEEVFKNKFLEQFITYHFMGICTPKGLEFLDKLQKEGLLKVCDENNHFLSS